MSADRVDHIVKLIDDGLVVRVALYDNTPES